ncbi:hypothetical protein AVEN_271589-1 [Araneus ventricosus]|uniref:Uncharacterized protein n=1 Tax=Araneus ventricosus TaxID=182803 RepID=A0A4Y2IWT2_ARAVE|nr:hypothetical protein AVEN_271589-1 [Araneus ventricosus]
MRNGWWQKALTIMVSIATSVCTSGGAMDLLGILGCKRFTHIWKRDDSPTPFSDLRGEQEIPLPYTYTSSQRLAVNLGTKRVNLGLIGRAFRKVKKPTTNGKHASVNKSREGDTIARISIATANIHEMQ